MTNETALKLERGDTLTPEELATLSQKAQAAYADSLADEAEHRAFMDQDNDFLLMEID
jgi:hypothetical protein